MKDTDDAAHAATLRAPLDLRRVARAQPPCNRCPMTCYATYEREFAYRPGALNASAPVTMADHGRLDQAARDDRRGLRRRAHGRDPVRSKARRTPPFQPIVFVLRTARSSLFRGDARKHRAGILGDAAGLRGEVRAHAGAADLPRVRTTRLQGAHATSDDDSSNHARMDRAALGPRPDDRLPRDPNGCRRVAARLHRRELRRFERAAARGHRAAAEGGCLPFGGTAAAGLRRRSSSQ